MSDLEDERLLRELGALWAKDDGVRRHGSADPFDPVLEEPLSEAFLDHVTDHVLALGQGHVASAQPGHGRARRRPLWMGAIAAAAAAAVALKVGHEGGGGVASTRDARPPLTAALDSEGSGQPVAITLPPAEYRIRPDTSTLVGDTPEVTFEVGAIPGSQVVIAGHVVALDANGNGRARVEVDSARLVGPADDVVRFDQSFGYSVTTPTGTVHTDALRVEISVTPLILDAPGADTVTDLDHFEVAGETTPDAQVSIAGRSLAVDAAGRFDEQLSMDSIGYTRVTVRATAPGLAPRFVTFKVQRVESLEQDGLRHP